MTDDQGILTLMSDLRIGSGSEPPLPPWASFMVLLGWWLADLPVVNGTLHFVALLPTRKTCSSLAALGALLHSAQRPGRDLSWREFASVPIGTRVYFQNPRPGRKFELCTGVLARSDYANLRCVVMDDAPNKYRQFIGATTFEKYRLRLTPYPTRRKMGRLDEVGSVLAKLIPGFDRRWLLSTGACCTLVTNIAAWQRDLEGVTLAGSGAVAIQLLQLLSIKQSDTDDPRNQPPNGWRPAQLVRAGSPGDSRWPPRLPVLALALGHEGPYAPSAQRIRSFARRLPCLPDQPEGRRCPRGSRRSPCHFSGQYRCHDVCRA